MIDYQPAYGVFTLLLMLFRDQQSPRCLGNSRRGMQCHDGVKI